MRLKKNLQPRCFVPTAAAIIIGNEILTGKFTDENGPWLAQECRRLGIDLERIVIIPDVIGIIADEVSRMCDEVDYVFTTGGIGPTHDDVTMAAIAAAFQVPLVRSESLEALIRAKMGGGANEAGLAMADVPEGTELWNSDDLKYPVTVFRNVIIFPGVPAFFKAKFLAICDRFSGSAVDSRSFRTEEKETSIAKILLHAQEKWPTVDIGSYPQFDTKPASVVVTLDGRNAEALGQCESWLRTQIQSSDGNAS